MYPAPGGHCEEEPLRWTKGDSHTLTTERGGGTANMTNVIWNVSHDDSHGDVHDCSDVTTDTGAIIAEGKSGHGSDPVIEST